MFQNLLIFRKSLMSTKKLSLLEVRKMNSTLFNSRRIHKCINTFLRGLT